MSVFIWGQCGLVPEVVLESIEITTPPTKTAYYMTESFDPTDMVVTAKYSDGTEAIVTDYTWTPEVMASDTTEVIISQTEGEVTVTASVAVTVTAFSTTLNDNTWSQIQEAAQAGIASSLWSVGDVKMVDISTNSYGLTSGSYGVFILGFDHNSTIEGENTIHFQFGKTAVTEGLDIAFVDTQYGDIYTGSTTYYFMMGTVSDNTPSGGWKSSNIKSKYSGSSGRLATQLPTELRAVVTACTKYTDNVGDGTDTASNVTATQDYYFLLSRYEVTGLSSGSNSAEQSYQEQYAYYKNGNSKIKQHHRVTTNACYWWLRSPFVSTTTGAQRCYTLININGAFGSAPRTYSYGFAPAFMVA